MYNDKVIDVVELDRKEQILNQLKESLNVSKDSEVVGIIEEYFKQKRSYEKSIELEKVQPVIDAINEKDPGYYWFRIKPDDLWAPCEIFEYSTKQTIPAKMTVSGKKMVWKRVILTIGNECDIRVPYDISKNFEIGDRITKE